MKQNLKTILRTFIIRIIILFFGWLILYQGFVRPDGRVDHWMSMRVVDLTRTCLAILGHDTNTQFRPDGPGINSRYVYVDGTPVLSVADGCNGIELIALFMGFIIAFPGKWNYKLTFIIIGSILIYLLNVIREVILALNYMFFRETFDFNHKYTYVLVVYSMVFLIWRFWLNRYSGIGNIVHRNEH